VKINRVQLNGELAAAGFPLRADNDGDTLYLLDGNLMLRGPDWPAGAAAVVAAHVPEPPPVVYAGQRIHEARVSTTGVTPKDLFRQDLAPLTGYTARVDVQGIDRANGNMRSIRASIVVKRLNAGAVIVPVTGGALFGLQSDHRDGAGGSWTVTPAADGNALVITVVGAASRTVDWFCRLSVDSFAPSGEATP